MGYNLSSDVLEQQFGPTEVEILYQDAMIRVICTKVVTSEKILELSRVEFIQSGIDVFPEVHRVIVAGQSMGKAFRAHKIMFGREVQSVHRNVLPDVFGRWFGSTNPATVVVVDIFVGVTHLPYARILETYSPNVLWPDPSRGPIDIQREMVSDFSKYLNTLGV